jgi:hypothetical protein
MPRMRMKLRKIMSARNLALYKWFNTLWFFSLPDLTVPDAEDENEIDEDHERKKAWPSINCSLLSGFFCP